MSESFLEILPLIIVGLVWIVAMSSKKKQHQRSMHEESHDGEYVPDTKNLGFPQGWKDEASKVEVQPSVRQEVKVEEVKTGRHKRIKLAEPSDPHNSASEGNSTLADFDLRKAVIYSEILKPKYDE